MDGLRVEKKVGMRIESIGGKVGVRYVGAEGTAWKMEEYVVAFVLALLPSRIIVAGVWFLFRLLLPVDAVLFVLRREPPGTVAPLPVLQVRPVASSPVGPEMRSSGC
jgi:hypothetical protein